MRVLFISPVALLGGGERSLLDLVAALREEDPALDLHAILGADGPLAPALTELGVAVRHLAMPETLAVTGDSALRGPGRARAAWRLARGSLALCQGTASYARTLRRAVAEIRPDVVHSGSLKTHVLGALAFGRDVPFLWHLRDFLGRRPLARRALQGVRRRVSAVAAVSHAVAHDARDLLPNVRIQVIHNSIDVNHFTPGATPPADLDALAGLPAADPGVVRVGLVSTYARWKGHETFLAAMGTLRRARPDLRFRPYVVGGAIYATHGSQHSREELQSISHATGAGAAFVPFAKDPRAIFQALDVVVHASTAPEPFGRSIVEGMASGRAVVAAMCGGVPEIIRDGEDALGVTAGNVPELAAAVARLCDDAPLRQRLGANGRDTAVRRFSRPRLGAELRELLESCVVRAAAPVGVEE